MKYTTVGLAAFALLGGLVLLGSIRGEGGTARRAGDPFATQPPPRRQSGTTYPNRPSTTSGTEDMGGMPGSDMSGMYMSGTGPSRNAARAEIDRLMTQLREADEAKKSELTKQLEVAVAKCFDDDMTVRETELAKLESRLAKLRAQLDRRRKAKDEIIQLHVRVLVNEVEGLGFSGVSRSLHDEPRTGIYYDPFSTMQAAGTAPATAAPPAIPARAPAARP